MPDKYFNKKIEVTEKVYADNGSSMDFKGSYNKTVGILTNVYSEHIELDNKILIATKYIYKIEIVD